MMFQISYCVKFYKTKWKKSGTIIVFTLYFVTFFCFPLFNRGTGNTISKLDCGSTLCAQLRYIVVAGGLSLKAGVPRPSPSEGQHWDLMMEHWPEVSSEKVRKDILMMHLLWNLISTVFTPVFVTWEIRRKKSFGRIIFSIAYICFYLPLRATTAVPWSD